MKLAKTQAIGSFMRKSTLHNIDEKPPEASLDQAIDAIIKK